MKGPNTHRFLEFRPVDVSQEGGWGSERNVHGTFLVTKSICEFSLTTWILGDSAIFTQTS